MYPYKTVLYFAVVDLGDRQLREDNESHKGERADKGSFHGSRHLVIVYSRFLTTSRQALPCHARLRHIFPCSVQMSLADTHTHT